jgi:hypothetical protein
VSASFLRVPDRAITPIAGSGHVALAKSVRRRIKLYAAAVKVTI